MRTDRDVHLIQSGVQFYAHAGPDGITIGEQAEIRLPDRHYMVPVVAMTTAKPFERFIAFCLEHDPGPKIVTLDPPEDQPLVLEAQS